MIPFVALSVDVLGLDRRGGTSGRVSATGCSSAVIVSEGHVTVWPPDRDLIDQPTPPGMPRRCHGDRADDDIFSIGVVVLFARLTVRLGIPAVDHEADLTFCGGAFGVCRDRLECGAGAGGVAGVRPQALVPAVAASELVAAHEGAHILGLAKQVVSAPAAAGNTSFLKEVACPAFAARHSGPGPRWKPGRRDLGTSRLAATGAQSGASSSRRGSPLPKSGPEFSSARKPLSMRQRISSSPSPESSGEARRTPFSAWRSHEWSSDGLFGPGDGRMGQDRSIAAVGRSCAVSCLPTGGVNRRQRWGGGPMSAGDIWSPCWPWWDTDAGRASRLIPTD